MRSFLFFCREPCGSTWCGSTSAGTTATTSICSTPTMPSRRWATPPTRWTPGRPAAARGHARPVGCTNIPAGTVRSGRDGWSPRVRPGLRPGRPPLADARAAWIL